MCEMHIDLICPDKRLSIIILVIILKYYDQVSLSIAIESDFKHAFYGFTPMPLEEYCQFFKIHGKDFLRLNR